jgi:hypothetical protein
MATRRPVRRGRPKAGSNCDSSQCHRRQCRAQSEYSGIYSGANAPQPRAESTTIRSVYRVSRHVGVGHLGTVD